MGDEVVHIVRGREIVRLDGRMLREQARISARVVVDVGAGDGRWIYRMARARPDWLCLALDADADAPRETSHRAARRPERGGARNVWFIRAGADELPPALTGLSDEVHVHFPWGTLLRAVLVPEPDLLRGILGLRNREGSVCVRLNVSVVEDPLVLRRLNLPVAGNQDLEARLRAGYGALGVHLDVRRAALDPETSWGRRLAAGRPLPVLALDGRAHPGNAETPAGVNMV